MLLMSAGGMVNGKIPRENITVLQVLSVVYIIYKETTSLFALLSHVSNTHFFVLHCEGSLLGYTRVAVVTLTVFAEKLARSKLGACMLVV